MVEPNTPFSGRGNGPDGEIPVSEIEPVLKQLQRREEAVQSRDEATASLIGDCADTLESVIEANRSKQ